ncbi:cytochrome P450 71A1 [Cannabis sativa]|uniref:cytochrome P450 71A1 n=1 Tax=Cannabis sativa TaxID=3483 RepID=UPI0029CA4A32|nr:cytochrome P450 71A1 [Cannabis sativa]
MLINSISFLATKTKMEMTLFQLLNQLHLHPNLHIVTFIFFLFFIIYLYIKPQKSDEKLSYPPSPPRLPIIGNLHQLGTHPHRSLRELSNKYGPLMLLRLGQVPTLVVSCGEIVREIIKKHDVVFSNRPITTAGKILLYDNKDVAFSPYGEYWRQVRKICVVELLSLKRVEQFKFVREEATALMVDRIRQICGKTNVPLNLSEMLMETSTDIICRCVNGKSFSSSNGGEEGGKGNRFGELSRRLLVQLMSFSFGDFFPCLAWIDSIRGFTASLKSTSKALDTFSNQVVEEHKAMMSLRSGDNIGVIKDNFVDILLRVQKDHKLEFELTQNDIKAIVQDMFLAGTETSSTTLEWLMTELMRHQKVMKKAQEEVRKIVGDKPKIDANDVNNMVYLKCVIKEVMRLHPPAPLLLARETTEKVELGGYHIPAKTQVFINAWAIHRDPKSWDRSEEFIPERFENDQYIDFKLGQDSHFIPFGFGRRGCPGLAFGLSTVEYLSANLLHWFDWKFPNEDDSSLDMSECYGLTVYKKVPLHLVPIPYLP